MNKKKYLVLTVISVIAFILITVGVTYSFFSYIGQGSTENTIESGTINFIYEEVNKNGNGISITDALPVSDTEGKASNNYFDFKVRSSTGTTITIPYEITARVSEGSDNLSDYVKLYLTKVNGNNEQQVALSVYSNLSDSTNTLASQFNDKTLYTDEIPVGASNYTENYRLRMWLNDNPSDGSVIDFSPVYSCSDTQYTTKTDCESNNGVWNPTENYNNQNKTFSIKINVYANGSQATQEKIASATTTDISGIKINNESAIENTNSSLNYDYYIETSMEDNNEIEVNLLNDGQTYTVENITEQEANTLRGVSTKQNLNISLGDNYLKVTVTSANKQNTKDYIVKARLSISTDATLHSLSIEDCPLNETFSSSRTTYTCSTTESSITPVYTKHSHATAVVNGNNNLELGNNTVTIHVTAENQNTELTYTITAKKVNSENIFVNASVGDTVSFTYTGDEEVARINTAGTYKIEAWGASGGNASTRKGGYGGYSVGEIELNQNEILYINVGGAGSNNCENVCAGGYNGGGLSRSNASRGTGGGATHVAKVSGLLENIGYTDFVTNEKGIIVAGGGGGASYFNDYYSGTGGSAGGMTGVSGTGYSASGDSYGMVGTGGSQITGGTGNPAGTFGRGADAGTTYGSYSHGGAGGGAGLYGGGASFNAAAAGGGSGYIGLDDLNNKSMYCFDCQESTSTQTYTVNTNPSKTLEPGATDERDLVSCPDGYSENNVSKCAKVGNGYVKITYLGN